MSVLHTAFKLATLPYGAVFREQRPGLVILVYHRIGGGTSSDIDLPTAEFAGQMAYLLRHYTLVSVDDVTTMSVSQELNGHADIVAVTFDDGYQDFYEHAFPVLLEHRIPATVYVTTAYIEAQRPFDFGELARASRRPQPLTWGQLREMVQSGLITVGAHTHTHPDLTRMPAAAVRQEAERCHRLIADRLGTAPRHFAYPWGRVTPAVRRVVGEYFKTAVRGGCGKNPFGTLDLLALWRRPIQQADVAWLFRLKLKSYLDAEERFRTIAAFASRLGRRRREAARAHADAGLTDRPRARSSVEG